MAAANISTSGKCEVSSCGNRDHRRSGEIVRSPAPFFIMSHYTIADRSSGELFTRWHGNGLWEPIGDFSEARKALGKFRLQRARLVSPKIVATFYARSIQTGFAP